MKSFSNSKGLNKRLKTKGEKGRKKRKLRFILSHILTKFFVLITWLIDRLTNVLANKIDANEWTKI